MRAMTKKEYEAHKKWEKKHNDPSKLSYWLTFLASILIYSLLIILAVFLIINPSWIFDILFFYLFFDFLFFVIRNLM